MNVPAVENVWLNVAPGSSGPLSNEPSSAVTVCWVESALVHVTVVPTGTVSVFGVNLKSWIVTDCPAVAEPSGADEPAGAAQMNLAPVLRDDHRRDSDGDQHGQGHGDLNGQDEREERNGEDDDDASTEGDLDDEDDEDERGTDLRGR